MARIRSITAAGAAATLLLLLLLVLGCSKLPKDQRAVSLFARWRAYCQIIKLVWGNDCIMPPASSFEDIAAGRWTAAAVSGISQHRP